MFAISKLAVINGNGNVLYLSDKFRTLPVGHYVLVPLHDFVEYLKSRLKWTNGCMTGLMNIHIKPYVQGWEFKLFNINKCCFTEKRVTESNLITCINTVDSPFSLLNKFFLII